MMYPEDDLKSPANFEPVDLRRNNTDDDGSITDVEETISLNGHDYVHRRRRRRTSLSSRSRRRNSTWFDTFKELKWFIDTCLLLMVLFLLLFRQSYVGDHFWEGAGDMVGFAPEFSQKIVTFSPDPGFMPENASDFFLPETQQKWLDLVPTGLGYVEIENPSKFDNLPTKLNGYEGQYVVTSSVTHQLHCLHSIAEAYAVALTNPAALEKMEAPWHLNHCFDYLRQSIMCCGDVALEGQQTTFPGGDVPGSDGWDAKHVCKDYGQIYSYLEKNRADDNKWI